MKNSFLPPFLLFLTIFSVAQEKTKENKWGLSFQTNSIEKKNPDNYNYQGSSYWDDELLYNIPGETSSDKSYSLGFKGDYFLRENTYVQLKFGMTKLNIYSSAQTAIPFTGGTDINNASKAQSNFHFSPGIGYYLRKGKIGFSGGFTVPFNIIGKSSVYQYLASLDQTGSLYYSKETNGTITNGWSIGVGTFAGFSIFPVSHFSFGPEFSFAYLYHEYGGTDTFHIIQKGVQNSDDIFNISRSFSKHDISEVQGSFNISYWF